MFVELIEMLRCPERHEETQLIASAWRTEARHIVEGVLGCPVCGAEFPIVDGVARFADIAVSPAHEQPNAEIAMRLAAFLDLTDGQGFALLFGQWSAQADHLRRLVDTAVVVVNPTVGIYGDVAGTMMVDEILPFAPSAVRCAALDSDASAVLAHSVVRAIRHGGRIVGPAALPIPEGVTELVRDQETWVGEKIAAPEPTPRLTALQRARR